MIDPHVVEISDIKRVVGSIAIGINDAIRLYVTDNNGNKRIRLRILDGNGVDTPAALQEAKDRNFASSTAPAFSFPHTAEIALIALNFPLQFNSFLAYLFEDITRIRW